MKFLWGSAGRLDPHGIGACADQFASDDRQSVEAVRVCVWCASG